jgi:hypothetical protein
MRSKIVVMAVAFGAFIISLSGSAIFASDEDEKLPPVRRYADKHMPKGDD